jgi:hypothetical protein
MENADYTLNSGAKLHLSSAPWELVVPLWSAVKTVTIGKTDNPEVGHLILASADVTKCLKELYPWATYDSVKLYPGLFDETKNGEQARGDYLEICEKLIEFHLRPFFLMTSSKSTDLKKAPTKNPESQ